MQSKCGDAPLKYKMKLPYLIFDYDGVIANSREAWLYSFRKTLKKLSHDHVTAEEFTKHAGPKTEATIESFLPEKEKYKAKEGKEIIDGIISTEGVERLTLCRNAKKTLQDLKKAGYSMSLLTNSDAAFVYPGLKKFGLDKGIFDLVITADDTFETKEDAIEFIAAVNKIEASDCAYIADREHDIEIARNVGAKIIAVSNEFSWANEGDIINARPDFIAKDLMEIPGMLKKLKK